MTYGISRPDWGLFGGPQADGQVTVLASTELSHAELVREVETVESWIGEPWRRLASPGTNLTVVMRGYVVVVADTYEQALRRLFQTWSPDAPPALPRSARS